MGRLHGERARRLCATVVVMVSTSSTRTVHPAQAAAWRRRSARAGALLLSGVLLLAACSDDTPATEPSEAETGVPLLPGTADPAASPTSEIAP